MKTATLLRTSLPQFHGMAALYRLDPPLQGHAHVVVSALEAPHHDPEAGGTSMHAETYIYGADADGVLADPAALPGSTAGTLDHRVVLLGAGYEATA
ncbi:hypothetical protein [Promicromonospora aerolata]|uniref:Uncharacterized protein n=1 Tax=Promicromonospora aerolata TaxID=195749 RepID=A0ABW4V3L4_9MICO